MKVFNLHKGNVKLFSDPTLTPKQVNIAQKGTTNLKLNKKFNSFVYVTLKSQPLPISALSQAGAELGLAQLQLVIYLDWIHLGPITTEDMFQNVYDVYLSI